MNSDNWTKIFSYSSEAEAELMKGLLSENGIDAVTMNKKDSAYLFGEVALYVQAQDALVALQLINSQSV
ncbi:MAG: DUF2007 domain-containing protein [Bacteroidota bacterium]